jgi:hypothetical protein
MIPTLDYLKTSTRHLVISILRKYTCKHPGHLLAMTPHTEWAWPLAEK